MYNKTITVFNQYEDKGEVTYYPTVIRNVDLNTDYSKIIAKYGENSKDKAQLHIRYQKGCFVSGKQYSSPKVWVKGVLAETITFAEGQDFFMEGEYPTTTPIKDEDFITSKYTGFYDFINSTNDNVFKITTVGIYDCIPHFEILGQ